MSGTFFTLMIVTMAAVLGALVIGIVGMAKGGAFAQKYGNRLMQLRVGLQAGALLLFVLAVAALKK